MSKSATELSAIAFDEVVSAPPVRRPRNYARSIFHVCSGIFALSLILLLPGRAWLVAASLAFAVAAWSMEIARRISPAVNDRLMRFFGPVAHAHERHQVNSSTWYMTALVLLALFAPLSAAAIGVVVLAVADPAAGFIGRRYGRIRLSAGRSLEGTLAFVVAGLLAVLVLLSALHALPWSTRVALAAAGAVAGALAELLITKPDDNFTIPLAAASAATLAQMLLPAM